MCTMMDSAVMEGIMKGIMKGEKELLAKQIENLRRQSFKDDQIEKLLSLPENKELVRQLIKAR